MLSRWIIFLGLALAGLSNNASAQRWAESTLPTPYNQGYYLDIYFLPNDAQYGWACDNDSGYVVRTTDGGTTWRGSRTQPTGFCHLEYIQFLDRTTGYCSGPCGVFKSVDGGASWTELTLPNGVNSIWGSWFRTAQVGWVLGGNCGRAQFLRTDDGGQSFTVFADTTIARSNLSDPLWMPDLPAGVVYAIGNGTLWASDDDGLTWGVVSYTGANSPWHEEIARYGNSFCIASAVSNCAGGGFTGGGVRFSANAGTTWREQLFPYDIFGVFLLDESRAWASGWRGSVKYSPDKGVTWFDRSCGIGTKNMDDIFFQNDTTGWVVGDGIFHLAPPLRTVSDSALTFNNACPDSSKYDTVWVENINFFDSPWELKFTGPEDYLFRIANAVPTPLPACSRVMVLVDYRATISGAHTATLQIDIYDPDTTLYVNLSGFRRSASASPTDTLVVFNARVGQTTDRVLNWRAVTIPSEQIVSVSRISGDTSIQFVATYPLNIPAAPAAQTIIRATPRDTGWITARFRVRLAPCMRDTFITVRVYGTSPILNCVAQAATDAGCSISDTLLIPISNTGNIPLTISRMQLQSTGTLAFSLLGFTSGRTGPPYIIPEKTTDTIRIEYISQSGDDVAALVIENDDFSLVRGNKRPWTVELRALSQRPQPVVRQKIIELGQVCEGASVDTLFSVRNDGTRVLTTLATPSSSRIVGLPTSAMTVTPTSTRTTRFRWTADRIGEIFDTIEVRVQPCDSVEYVVLHASVISGGIAIAPSPVVDSVLVGGTLMRTIVIKPLPGQTVTVTSITYDPPAPDLVLNIPSTPIVLGSNDSAVVTVTWNPKTVTRVTGTVLVSSEGNCAAVTNVGVDLKSLSNDVSVTPSSISYLVRCIRQIQTDSVRIESRSTANITLRIPTIVETGTAFSVASPTTSVVVTPGQVMYVVVAFDPTIADNSAGTLRLVIDPAAETFDVTLSGKFEYSTVDRIQTGVNFDTVGVCDPLLMRTVEIYNNGNTDENVSVDLSNAPAGVSVVQQSFIVAAVSSSMVTIQCDPSQLNTGASSGTIVFRGRTCSDTTSIDVSAMLMGGRLQMIPDPVNAGTVVIGSSVPRTVTIGNPTSTPRTILQLSIEPPSPDWNIVGSADGIVVDPGIPLSVDVRFAPTAAGDRNATLRLIDAERCTTQTAISLLGRGQDPTVPPQHSMTLRIDEYRVAPGTHVNVPVKWVGDVSAGIIDTLVFDVDYSALHYVVDTIHAGDIPDALVQSSLIDGKLSISVMRNGPSFGIGGNIVVMSGVATPAIPDSTFLSFTNIRAVTNEVTEVRIDDGLLVIDACGPRNMILYTSPTTVRVMPPHPIGDVLNLQVQAPYMQHLRVKLIDAIGNAVTDLGEFEVSAGESNVTIALPTVATGMYGLTITTDYGGVFSAMLVLTK